MNSNHVTSLLAIFINKTADEIKALLTEKYPSIPTEMKCPVTLEQMNTDEIVVYMVGPVFRTISIFAYNRLLKSPGSPSYRICPVSRQPITHAVTLRHLIRENGPWHPWSEYKERPLTHLKTAVEIHLAKDTYVNNLTPFHYLIRANHCNWIETLSLVPNFIQAIDWAMLTDSHTAIDGDSASTVFL